MGGISYCLTYSSEQKYSGNYSFAMRIEGTPCAAQFSQTITGLTVGTTYELTGWYNSSGLTANEGGIGSAAIQIGGYKFDCSIGQSGWNQFSISYTATALSVAVTMELLDHFGTLYVDDLSLVESSPAFTETEINWLAQLICWEGRGFTSNYPKELIAQVAANRVNSSAFPNTLEEVLKQSGQYGYPTAGATATLIFNNAWVNHAEYNLCKDSCIAAVTRGDLAALSLQALKTPMRKASMGLYEHSFVYKKPEGTEYPACFVPEYENIRIDAFDQVKYISVGETALGAVLYPEADCLFFASLSNSSVGALTLGYADTEEGTWANYSFSGTVPGHTTVYITAPQVPSALGIIDIFVSD